MKTETLRDIYAPIFHFYIAREKFAGNWQYFALSLASEIKTEDII